MAPKEGGRGAGELAESKSLDALKGESAALRSLQTQSPCQGPDSALSAPISSPVLCVGFGCTKLPPMTGWLRAVVTPTRSWCPDRRILPTPPSRHQATDTC